MLEVLLQAPRRPFSVSCAIRGLSNAGNRHALEDTIIDLLAGVPPAAPPATRRSPRFRAEPRVAGRPRPPGRGGATGACGGAGFSRSFGLRCIRAATGLTSLVDEEASPVSGRAALPLILGLGRRWGTRRDPRAGQATHLLRPFAAPMRCHYRLVQEAVLRWPPLRGCPPSRVGRHCDRTRPRGSPFRYRPRLSRRCAAARPRSPG
jgi:hypothetical protein